VNEEHYEMNEYTKLISGMINSVVRNENVSLRGRCEYLQKQLGECKCKLEEQKDIEPAKTECLTTKNLETMKDLRKCEFELNGEFVDGFFHKWESENAIVEDRKGRCHLVEMNKVRFTDFLRDTMDKVLGR
jgi:hypothetical protein